jgi:hypothetical protein
MAKAGVHKPPGSGGNAEKPSKSAREHVEGADFPMHEHIGRQLKLLYDEIASEPIPEKLRELLDKLDRKEKKS